MATPDILPEGLTAYRRTPVFDQDSVPAGLRLEHRTKEGVWAVIHVLEGRLIYRRLDPRDEQVLMPGVAGIVRPEAPHEVEPLGPVRFFVEFHAAGKPPEDPH